MLPLRFSLAVPPGQEQAGWLIRFRNKAQQADYAVTWRPYRDEDRNCPCCGHAMLSAWERYGWFPPEWWRGGIVTFQHHGLKQQIERACRLMGLSPGEPPLFKGPTDAREPTSQRTP